MVASKDGWMDVYGFTAFWSCRKWLYHAWVASKSWHKGCGDTSIGVRSKPRKDKVQYTVFTTLSFLYCTDTVGWATETASCIKSVQSTLLPHGMTYITIQKTEITNITVGTGTHMLHGITVLLAIQHRWHNLVWYIVPECASLLLKSTPCSKISDTPTDKLV